MIIFFAAKDGEALYSQQKQDRELTVARSGAPYCQIQTQMKKIGETNIPVRYNLNQASYSYTVEVRNRFKGLDLIDTVPEELWMEVSDIVQEAVVKTIPQEKKCKKATWLSEESLQIAEKRRGAKGKGKGKDIPN